MDEVINPGGESELVESQPASGSAPEPTPAAGALPETSAPAPGAWNATEYTLNYKGQPVIPKDKQHLINLAQQGYGYSQSMEQLKRDRQELKKQQDLYGQYAQLDERFKGDPAFQRHILQAVEAYQAAKGTGQPAEVPPQLNELLQWKQQQEKKQADAEVKAEIDELKKTYADEKWDFDDGEGTLIQKVLKHAYEKGITSIASAYRDFMYDRKIANARADALKQAEAKKAEEMKAGKVGGGTSSPAPGKTTEYTPGDSYNALTEKALSMIK